MVRDREGDREVKNLTKALKALQEAIRASCPYVLCGSDINDGCEPCQYYQFCKSMKDASEAIKALEAEKGKGRE